MKNKKILSVILVVIFVLSIGLVPAFAAETNHNHTDECSPQSIEPRVPPFCDMHVYEVTLGGASTEYADTGDGYHHTVTVIDLYTCTFCGFVKKDVSDVFEAPHEIYSGITDPVHYMGGYDIVISYDACEYCDYYEETAENLIVCKCDD